MSILKKLSVGTAGAVVVATALAADPAQAFTFTSTPYSSATCPAPDSCTSSQAGATNLTFNSGFPTSGPATYTIPRRTTALRTGSQSGVYATPLGDTTQFLAVGPSPNASPITINFSTQVNYFGLYWGSIDNSNNNTISFYRNQNDATPFKTYTGANILATAAGSQTEADSNRYVNFFSESSSENFTKVTLSAAQQAFENDNHSYRQAAVPEPLTILGSGMALGFGILMKREYSRKRQNT